MFQAAIIRLFVVAVSLILVGAVAYWVRGVRAIFQGPGRPRSSAPGVSGGGGILRPLWPPPPAGGAAFRRLGGRRDHGLAAAAARGERRTRAQRGGQALQAFWASSQPITAIGEPSGLMNVSGPRNVI
jgi:hypothetical protein